jgi:hypothetical protein
MRNLSSLNFRRGKAGPVGGAEFKMLKMGENNSASAVLYRA